MRRGRGQPASLRAHADRPIEGVSCCTESVDAVTVVRPLGLLDIGGAPVVRTALHEALAARPPAVIVDLSGLAVADDFALMVLTPFARSAAAWPACPVLLCGAGALAEGLNRMGINRVLPVYPDLAAALVAAAATPVPRRYGGRLLAEPRSAALARRVVRDACRAWKLPHLVDDAELVVTELVSNAVRHAGGDLELVVVLRGTVLHISLRDGSPDTPRRNLPDPDSGEGGRGLMLLDAVASGWGSTPDPPGKVVWATVRVPR